MTAQGDGAPTLERVRDRLTGRPSVREVRMFGGISFMIEDKLAVNVRRDGRLLVRIDPADSAALVADRGARRARMGPDRDMGPSWLDVDPDLLATDEALGFWVGTALAYTARLPSARVRR